MDIYQLEVERWYVGIYAKEVERLVKADRHEMRKAWTDARLLFQFCSPSGGFANYRCGCLTSVRGGADSFSQALTDSIRRDYRLPRHIDELYRDWDAMSEHERRKVLRVFAEWQIAMDMTIRDWKPWHPEFAPVLETIEETREAVLI